MTKNKILALDQGTTSSRAILFDDNFKILGIEQSETKQIYPRATWVEQDPTEIRETQFFVIRKLLARLNIKANEIAAIGITNQRETTIVWEKKTGKPIYNAIIWQDKRTKDLCNTIKNSEFGNYITNTTGLIVDSYFSATKIQWILKNVRGAYEKAKKGEILFGTIDTWLIWNLTRGKLHITDHSNASRTMLYNIKSLSWDKTILDYFDIPEQILPTVTNSSAIHGTTAKDIFDNTEITIAGIAGDQQAALFGQTCFSPGDVKNTYGTGCFMLMNTGTNIVKSTSGLVTTIAWGIDNKINYAIEGSVFIAGAAIQWLRDKLRIIENAAETENIALEIENTDGVYFVPAFAGLGAPYWDMEARGIITGITGNTTYKHIVRAAIEAMAFQTKDVINAMELDSNIKINNLNVDGGATVNNFLLQFQSDILGINVIRPEIVESTALGAAFLAAIAVKMYNIDELKNIRKTDKIFKPTISEYEKNKLYKDWGKAVNRILLSKI